MALTTVKKNGPKQIDKCQVIIFMYAYYVCKRIIYSSLWTSISTTKE